VNAHFIAVYGLRGGIDCNLRVVLTVRVQDYAMREFKNGTEILNRYAEGLSVEGRSRESHIRWSQRPLSVLQHCCGLPVGSDSARSR